MVSFSFDNVLQSNLALAPAGSFGHLQRVIIYSVGFIVLLQIVYTALHGVYARLLRPGKNLKKKYGLWAVVTGSTDGIGKGMAFELAKKGHNIVLISRSKDKLDACRDELLAKYPKVEVKVIAVDFGKFNESARKNVAEFLKDLDIGVLVNNIGVSYPFTKYFHELEDINVEQLITLNIDSTTWMTRIVLPGMVERKRGSIVNIGSAAGVSNSPLLAQYGAAKSYITMFSRTLNVELEKFHIHVQCQVPMFVATKLAKIKKTSLFVASPSAYARAAVAAIGYEAVVSPYWSHALQIWVLTTMPEWITSSLVLSMHHGIRKAGMKKEAKQAADEGKSKSM
jgi:17beta-estradiol 17-dehydrogenase / very-long-chain 3-oxoacyl-CoA reductase